MSVDSREDEKLGEVLGREPVLGVIIMMSVLEETAVLKEDEGVRSLVDTCWLVAVEGFSPCCCWGCWA